MVGHVRFRLPQSSRQVRPKGIGRAIEKDHGYALAYAGLADAYWWLTASQPPKLVMPKAKVAALKALELDGSLAEAHVAVANVCFYYDWDWVGAETEFRRALELNSSCAPAHQYYGTYLAAMGHFQRANAELERAKALDPLSLDIMRSATVALYLARQYDQAIEQLLQRAFDPHSPAGQTTHIAIGQSYMQKGEITRALAEIQAAKRWLGDHDVSVVCALAQVYAQMGNKDEARKLLYELTREAERTFVSAFMIAAVETSLGNKDEAFDWLEKSYELREDSMISLKFNPEFDGLRSDPRFPALLKKMNLENQRLAVLAPKRISSEDTQAS